MIMNEEKNMTITGEKVIKRIIIDCPECNRSFSVNWKDVLESPISSDIMCPWCEHVFPSSYGIQPSRLVYKIDKVD